MHQLNSILENQRINRLIAGYKKSPRQLNDPHESDAEIIKVNNLLLAITTDSISEEILTGLYDNPYLIGWMIVTMNMSDLAAVDAKPLGIVISEIIPKNYDMNKVEQLQSGLSDACKTYNTFVLGGDTNEGDKLLLTGTAIGIIDRENPITRVGCKPGEILYSSGKLGAGNAYAISKLISGVNIILDYKPYARMDYCNIINKYASSCMDTSDGFLATLDQLKRINKIGFELNADWYSSIDNDSLACTKALHLPAWLLFAGQHGEFELIFTIPKNNKNRFLDEALLNNFVPIELGRVITGAEIIIPLYDELISLDTALIRNLPYEANDNIYSYLQKLLEYDDHLKTKTK